MKDRGVIIAILAGLGLWLWSKRKPAEAALVGEPIPVVPVTIVRHPEIPVGTAYSQLGVKPTSDVELLKTQTTQQAIVSPVIDIVETTENRKYIEAIEDAEEVKLNALPKGTQCTTTFLDGSGNYYACCNGYAILTIRATETPAVLEAKKEEIKTTGTVAVEPLSWMEKELLEQARTGYTEVQRHKMVNDYRLAHPGVSGSRAYDILFGSYLGR